MKEIVEYKVGYNFDLKVIDSIYTLNKDTKSAKVKSVYASSTECDWLTARPRYRLPEISIFSLKQHIEYIHMAGLEFFYPLNAPYIGSKSEIEKNKQKILDLIHILEEIGVDGIILTHPIIAAMIKCNSHMKISISSIANIFSVNQIKMWQQLYGAQTFCLSPYFNKEIKKLIKMEHNIELINSEIELIVNEMCALGFSSGQGGSPCIFRESCFLCHSENVTQQDDELLNGYPQSFCIKNRSNVINSFWGKTQLIRPEDVLKYLKIGIHKFKITGRTAKSEDLLRVLKAYMTFCYDGAITDLWYMKNDAKTINNKKLEGMIDFWFINKEHCCDNELCGMTCNYCNDFLDEQCVRKGRN